MGRPRKFDAEVVLDRAMEVFWRQGYGGAGMSSLTEATGLNSPSLYGAFGNKRGLFTAVLDRYEQRRAAHRDWMLHGKTAYEVAERMLVGAVQWLTTETEPLGCLLLQAGLAAGEADDGIPTELAKRRAGLRRALKKRFERAKLEGDLPADADPDKLARLVHTVFLGLAVQAAAGVSQAQLLEVAHMSLAGWPGRT